MNDAEPFTLGVEEEYFVVDAENLGLRPRAERVLRRAQWILGEEVEPELSASQVEVGTPVCRTLAEVRANLCRLRRACASAAEAVESRIAAMGSHPVADWLGQGITHKERYEALDEVYQQLAREQLICGCHVHVAVAERDVAVRIMDRVRPWLPVLLALTANSPYWEGVDTGYASFRTMTFDRWPTSGTPMAFGSRAAYDQLVGSLVEVGAVADATTLYWDVRPSARYETLEFRVADVCTTVDDAVTLAGLARSLVRTAYQEVLAGAPPVSIRPELLRVARWRAARYGLDGMLIHAGAPEQLTGPAFVHRLLDHCRADLEAHGEWEEVTGSVAATLGRGNGATRQRRAFDRRGSLQDVVAEVVAATVGEG